MPNVGKILLNSSIVTDKLNGKKIGLIEIY